MVLKYHDKVQNFAKFAKTYGVLEPLPGPSKRFMQERCPKGDGSAVSPQLSFHLCERHHQMVLFRGCASLPCHPLAKSSPPEVSTADCVIKLTAFANLMGEAKQLSIIVSCLLLITSWMSFLRINSHMHFLFCELSVHFLCFFALCCYSFTFWLLGTHYILAD